MKHTISFEGLASNHRTQLAASTANHKAMYAELRITEDSYSHWFVVKTDDCEHETQSLSQAIRWYNTL